MNRGSLLLKPFSVLVLLAVCVIKNFIFAQALDMPRPPLTARVHVRPIMVDGEELRHPAWIDSFKDEEGKEWRNLFDFDSGTGTNIPYGTYHVEASHPLTHMAFSGALEVFHEDVLSIVGFEGEPIEGSDRARALVKGTISGLTGANAKSWCQLMSIYGREQYETPLNNGSGFNFGLVAVGNYIMACVNQDKLLFTKPIKVNYDVKTLQLIAR